MFVKERTRDAVQISIVAHKFTSC